MIEMLLLYVGIALITILAYKDLRYQEYEWFYLILICFISIIIFLYNGVNYYTDYDIMAIGLFLGVTIILLLSKQIKVGDIALILLFVIAPFNAALALIFASLSLFLIMVFYYFTKSSGDKQFQFLSPPYPFITYVFIFFVLITAQMYLSTEYVFWNICRDLSLNNETYHCTFVMETYEYTNTTHPSSGFNFTINKSFMNKN